MPYRSMTLKELAQMLGADSRRLERMAERGQIPCQKVGGQIRFNRAQITEWLQRNMGTLSRAHLDEVDAGITAHRRQGHEEVICPLLRIEAISANLGSKTKNSTLKELVALAQATGLVHDRDALLEAVVQREELCSTAMNGGMAIPHPRRPLPYALAEPILVVAKTSQGIGFGAPDGQLTRLFLLTASQDDHHHIHILARLCRMLDDRVLIGQLEDAQTAQEMMERIKNREQQIISESD